MTARWVDLDGMIHVAGDCRACNPRSQRACRCGSVLHRQPAYGGIIENCEACGAWETTPVPPHDNCGMPLEAEAAGPLAHSAGMDNLIPTFIVSATSAALVLLSPEADRLDAQRLIEAHRDAPPSGGLTWVAAVTGPVLRDGGASRAEIINAEVARWQARIPGSRVLDLRK